jgi:hypothetical protein
MPRFFAPDDNDQNQFAATTPENSTHLHALRVSQSDMNDC